jgi:hypothetical protein
VVVCACFLEESCVKIAAALKGKRAHRTFTPVRMRVRYRIQRPMRTSARWRAAA